MKTPDFFEQIRVGMDRIWMRGKPKAQPDFLTDVKLYDCVPVHHPLRVIKRHLDFVLKKLSPEFDQLYEELGLPSIPPEQTAQP